MSEFISVITNEAMERICYDGGWVLTPYQFAVTNTDPLEGYSDDDIYDSNGDVNSEIYAELQKWTTEDMQNDINANNVWCQLAFSSVTRATTTSLTHHIVIPPNISSTGTDYIKNIYFIYKDQNDELFLYGMARANSTLLYEEGVTQSFFFTFTVTNSTAQETTEFLINYSYPQEIEDHNVDETAHDFLVARDGSRTLTDQLLYEDGVELTDDNALITKQYVDELIEELESYTFVIGEPRFTLTSVLPSNCIWLQGDIVSRTTYSSLFSLYGTYYGSGDGSTTFQLPDFTARTIWGRSSSTNQGYIEEGLPNIEGTFRARDLTDDVTTPVVSGALYYLSRKYRDAQNGSSNKGSYGIGFNASLYNSIYGNSDNVQPNAVYIRAYTRYQ